MLSFHAGLIQHAVALNKYAKLHAGVISKNLAGRRRPEKRKKLSRTVLKNSADRLKSEKRGSKERQRNIGIE